MVFLFRAATMLVALVTACAHLYIQETGTASDYDTIVEWIPKLREVSRTLFRGGPFSPLLLLEAALLYAALDPRS